MEGSGGGHVARPAKGPPVAMLGWGWGCLPSNGLAGRSVLGLLAYW